MILKKEQFQTFLAPYLSHFKKDFRVKRFGLFGSFARNEQTETSDIDILVEFERSIGIFTFIKLQEELHSIFGRKVDLATPRALKLQMKDTILREATWIERL